MILPSVLEECGPMVAACRTEYISWPKTPLYHLWQRRSIGWRIWLKHYVQQLANETQMKIQVSQFPTETSKWNKIEHRLICYISKKWLGQSLVNVETVGSTTTENGLSAVCHVDENHYEPGKKITEERKDNLNIKFVGPNEKWNYIIRPNRQLISWKFLSYAWKRLLALLINPERSVYEFTKKSFILIAISPVSR